VENNKIEIGAEEEMLQMIAEGKLQGKKPFAMGRIVDISRLNDTLEKYGMVIDTIVDNNPRKWGTTVFFKRIYHIVGADYFFHVRNENTLLLIYSVRFWPEMKDQMLANGLKEFRDFYILEAPTQTKREKYVRKGYSFIQNIRRQYGPDAYLMIFYGPIGDNYLFSLFYKQYLRENEIENCVFLGTSITQKIGELFQFPNFILLDEETFLSLEYAYMFLGEDLEGVKFLQIWEFVFHFNRCRIRMDRRFTFIDTYLDYVYHLKKYRRPILPTFCADTSNIEAVFNQNGLEKGNTVILSPYAYSIPKKPPKKFWEILIDRLKQRGAQVALNINKQKEEDFIKSIPQIEFPLKSSVPYLEYAGGFIGMRSGFCDVISSASCTKIVLYPEEDLSEIDYDRHRSDQEFGGLKAMGLADDAIELKFDANGSLKYWEDMAEWIAERWREMSQ